MDKLQMSLKACRINAGMTQQEVADKLNVSKVTISNWESGATSPAFYKVQQLSELYKVPLDNIFLPQIST